MREYAVHATIHFVYMVPAETPEEAAYDVENGYGGNGRSIDANVDRVTAVAEHDWEYDNLPELRDPVTCTKCGKVQPAGSQDVCTDCYVASRVKENADA